MNQKSIFADFSPEDLMLRLAVLVPVLALCLFVAIQFKSHPVHGKISEKETLMLAPSVFSGGLQDWSQLSWEEKEKRVNAGILYFRQEKNCAILQSPGHYVVLLDGFLKGNPSFQKKDLVTLLYGLAVQEYDFYSGINADDQALNFLGPDLFRKNREMQQAARARLQPVEKK